MAPMIKRKRPMLRRIYRKNCRLCAQDVASVDYKDIEHVSRFITERGKIVPARLTGTCAKHQRKVAMAVKQARYMALIPYVAV